MKKLRNLLLFILAWLTLAWTAVAAPPGLPVAMDFQADGKIAHEKQVPILVMFGSANCGFCRRALRDYLVPMHLDPAYRGKVMMRYVEIDSILGLKNFAGVSTSQKEFAKMHNILVTPTIKLFNASGAEVSEPLVGLLSADFYGAYLDRAIDEGLGRLRVATRDGAMEGAAR